MARNHISSDDSEAGNPVKIRVPVQHAAKRNYAADVDTSDNRTNLVETNESQSSTSHARHEKKHKRKRHISAVASVIQDSPSAADEPRTKKKKAKHAALPVDFGTDTIIAEPLEYAQDDSAPSKKKKKKSDISLLQAAIVDLPNTDEQTPETSTRKHKKKMNEDKSLPDRMGFTLDPSLADCMNQSADPNIMDYSHFDSSDDLLRALSGVPIARLPRTPVGKFPMPSTASPLTKKPANPRKKETIAVSGVTVASLSANPGDDVENIARVEFDMSDYIGPTPGSWEDHATILWSKWLSAAKLTELSREMGLTYKKGKFSKTEEAQVAQALGNYASTRGISHEDILEIIFSKGTKKVVSTEFWQYISLGRPIIGVYNFVRRRYNPLGNQGKWTQEEDDLLRNVVAELGPHWEKVSIQVGRTAGDCRDRYRNYLNNQEKRMTGQWSRDEENELISIVQAMTVEMGKDPDHDVFWTVVSERMGHRRSRQQCRIKWQDSLSKRIKNNGEVPHWTPVEGYNLVHLLKTIAVQDDSEFNWRDIIANAAWCNWSEHEIQRRWMSLKRAVEGHETLLHSEIMAVLCAKYADPPSEAKFINGHWVFDPERRHSRKTSRIISAHIVDDQFD